MIDAFLINSMPIAILLKTIMFSALWITLFFQVSRTKLGVWLNVFFLFTSLTSFTVGNFVWYVSDLRTPHELINTKEWVLVIFMNILPFMTSISGIMVARYAHWAEETIKDNRDKRQDSREDAMDKRAQGLDDRGMMMSKDLVRRENEHDHPDDSL